MTQANGYRCPTCGCWSEGMPTHWNLPLPDPVSGIPPSERQGRVEETVVGELLAVDDEHFFIRANLEFPIAGSEELLSYTCWMSLSRRNATRQLEHWFTEGRERTLEPMVGYLSNELAGFPGSFLHVARIHTQPVGVRPSMEPEPTDHPLARAYRDGVSLELVRQLAHEYGCEAGDVPGAGQSPGRA